MKIQLNRRICVLGQKKTKPSWNQNEPSVTTDLNGDFIGWPHCRQNLEFFVSRHINIQTFLSFVFLSTCFAKPLIVAHRGASFDAPENTLPAFELAWEQGADAIEGDFLLTKDKQIVCIHDHSTKRLADRDLEVKSSTLAELKSLDVGFWKDKKYKNTRIPTLAEVFATIPDGKKIFVEIKCGTCLLYTSPSPRD